MINSLKLTNFQGHAETEIQLDPVLTAITGSSDAGKSAIIRAIKWLVYNKPSAGKPSNWIKSGEDSSVICNTGATNVTRIKGKSGNGYNLGDKEFRAIGTDIPEDVSEFLDMSDINFAGQHDAPFLLSMTPGEVGRYLNKLIDLDVIDDVLQSANSSKRKVNDELQFLKKDQAEKTTQLQNLSWVDTASRQADLVHEAELKYQKDQKEYVTLSSLYEQIAITKEKLQSIRNILELVAPYVQAIPGQRAAITVFQKEYNELATARNNYNYTLQNLNLLKQIPVDKALSLIKRCGKMKEALELDQSDAKKLQSIIAKHSYDAVDLAGTRELIEAENEWIASLGICPTCGQKVVK